MPPEPARPAPRRARPSKTLVRALFALVPFALPFLPHISFAQSTGISADRYVPAPGPSAFGQVEAAKVPVAVQLFLTGSLSAIGNPIVLQNSVTKQVVATPVRHRVTLDLGAELGVFRKRLALGFAMPLALYQDGDRLQRTGGSADSMSQVATPLAPAALGDIRFRGKALLTPVDRIAGLALVLELTVPGGGQANFAATSSVTFSPRLVTSLRYRFFAGGFNLGLRFMPERELYESRLHHRLEWGGALGADLFVRRVAMALIAEAAGEVNLVRPQLQTSTEVRGIIRIGWAQGSLDLGGGGGFGSLTPQWRAFVAMRFVLGRFDGGCPAKPVTL